MRTRFLHAWVLKHAERRPDAPAVATPATRVTYGDLAARVRAFAAHLAACGIGHGGRALVALPNEPATVVVARGDNVTPGHLGEPAETAAILRGGWLWTGDVASRDADGFFFHRGRSKEILEIGGHRVSPIAIEQVLARHPDVAETAVVGVKDDLKGEVGAAFVVPRPGRTPGEDMLRRFCREHLPAYEVPGKLMRTQLPQPAPR